MYSIYCVTMLWSEWHKHLRPTSCFIRHFPSSVRSAVGCAEYAVCTESIIMSSSTQAQFSQNQRTSNHQLINYYYSYFLSPPSISSLFAAASCVFLSMQLTARRRKSHRLIICLKLTNSNNNCHMFILRASIFAIETVYGNGNHSTDCRRCNLLTNSSTSLVSIRIRCSSSISCVTWLS